VFLASERLSRVIVVRDKAFFVPVVRTRNVHIAALAAIRNTDQIRARVAKQPKDERAIYIDADNFDFVLVCRAKK